MKMPGWLKIIIGFIVAISVTFLCLGVVGMAISLANKSPIEGEDIFFLAFGIMAAIPAFIAVKYRHKVLMIIIQETLGNAPKSEQLENDRMIVPKIVICIFIAVSISLIYLGINSILKAPEDAYLYENGWEVIGEVEGLRISRKRDNPDKYYYTYVVTYVNAKGENEIYTGYRILREGKSDEWENELIGKKVPLYIDDRGGVCLTVEVEKKYKNRYVIPLGLLFTGIIGLIIFLKVPTIIFRHKKTAHNESENS
jgi:hypothetical protein